MVYSHNLPSDRPELDILDDDRDKAEQAKIEIFGKAVKITSPNSKENGNKPGK